jgi:hypothetical protein
MSTEMGDNKGSSELAGAGAGNHEKNGLSNALSTPGGEAFAECPPHTTETKLLAKIDLHVLPWLCLMYLLAFLGKETKYRLFCSTKPVLQMQYGKWAHCNELASN